MIGTDMIDWYKEVPFAITISDLEGNIIYMNDKSDATFSKYGGRDKIVGTKLVGYHSPRSVEIINKMLNENCTNSYTITKNKQKKLIHQSPYYVDGKIAGLVELSIVLPDDMPHYDRDKQ